MTARARIHHGRDCWAGHWMAAGLVCAIVLAGCERTPEARAIALVSGLGGKVKLAGTAPDEKLAEIDLSRTRVTDADLEELPALSSLEALNLSGTAITDRGLTALGKFSGLRKLNLNLTKISDRGLAELVGLEQLEDLYLIETGVTDAGAEQLARLGHLKMLSLLRTRLSAQAVAQLRRALPAATIQIEPRRTPVP